MMRDPDLQRPPTSGDVRVLVLPSGGTIEIPMPKSKSKAITIKPPASAFRGSAGGSITLPVVLGLAVGVAIGGGIMWFVLRHKN